MATSADSAPFARGTAALLLVSLTALAVAGLEYAHFLDVHRDLWVNSTHDRNAHYLYALKLATALRHFDLYHFLDEIQRARVWPPFHGIIASLVLTAGGSDYRLAVLPSLLAWAGSAVLAFLTARRALPRGGSLAGLIAALYLLVSPLHRAFATDIMLESVGACLTLAVIHAYLTAVQEQTQPSWRILGLLLTLLFLHKYNYWMIGLLGLGLADLLGRFDVYRELVLRLVSAPGWRGWLVREARHPLNALIAVVLLLVGFLFARGDRPLLVAGRSINVYPPENLISLAYALFFLRLAAWWRASRDFRPDLDDGLRQLLVWHGWPVAVFFLLPRHLTAWLWYLSPANTGPGFHTTLLERVEFYRQHGVAHYHLGDWSALLAVLLFLAGLLSLRRFRPGASAIFLVGLLGALLTALHPNLQGRFLHTWMGAVWVGAGLGAVALASLPGLLGWRRLGLGCAGLATLAILVLHGPGLIRPVRTTEAGPVPVLPSLLDVTDSFAHDLDAAGQATVLATVPVKPLVQWSFLERRGGFGGLEENWDGFGGGELGESNRAGFRRWLEQTRCDTLVFVERLPGGNWEEVGEIRYHQELRDLLEQQTTFHPVKEVPFPRHGCRVLVYKR
jgi:hypothetical protein